MVRTRLDVPDFSGDEEKQEDRISKLPSELIHYIMSFMDTKYAIQTSVLSKRWIDIWKSLPFLSFDMDGGTLQDLVDRVFMFRDSCNIRWFRLICKFIYYYDDYYCQRESPSQERLSTWIEAAVNRNVQEVKLEFLNAHSYTVPYSLLNCKSLENLTLVSHSYVDVVLPKSMRLPKLKSMSLGGFRMSNNAEAYALLFSSCPLLEKLNIRDCDIQTVQSLSLKKFAYTLHWQLHDPQFIIMLSAPNLINFTCDYSCDDENEQLSIDEKKVNYTKADKRVFYQEKKKLLKRKNIENIVNAERMVKLLVGVNKVEQLNLSPGFLEVLSTARDLLSCQLHCLLNLQCLRLETWFTGDSFRVIAYLLEISPNIKSLILKLKGENLLDAGDDWEEGISVPGMLSNLKIVRIKEMIGCNAELKLLNFLLKNAKVLEEVSLYPCSIANSSSRIVMQFMNKLRALPSFSSRIKLRWVRKKVPEYGYYSAQTK